LRPARIYLDKNKKIGNAKQNIPEAYLNATNKSAGSFFNEGLLLTSEDASRSRGAAAWRRRKRHGLDAHRASRGSKEGVRLMLITFGVDDRADELKNGVGAVKLLDKKDLADQLIPAILELAPAGTTQPNWLPNF
jgi:hypothetical protein